MERDFSLVIDSDGVRDDVLEFISVNVNVDVKVCECEFVGDSVIVSVGSTVGDLVRLRAAVNVLLYDTL